MGSDCLKGMEFSHEVMKMFWNQTEAAVAQYHECTQCQCSIHSWSSISKGLFCIHGFDQPKSKIFKKKCYFVTNILCTMVVSVVNMYRLFLCGNYSLNNVA